MGAKHAIQRHRAHQHRHALERLRERYLPDATHEQLIELRDLSREAARNVKALPGSDVRQVFVTYHGKRICVVYCPRYDAVRTVLPA